MSKPQITICMAFLGAGLITIGLAMAVLNWQWPSTIFTLLGIGALSFALGALTVLK